ncbi:MAG TPA: transketolase [Bacteroidota bacterium]|nr:transketolase [Bacteroidota bacterium]
MTTTNATSELDQLAATTIRILSAEGVQKANSGHPGMPMGMADVAYVLWTKFLRFTPEDPQWINRDRFILSAGHGSMLLYTMLHLSGYDVTLEDLKSFRQFGSRTAGHPEFGFLPGIEVTSGPLGAGFANGVGMAIAANMLASRYNTGSDTLFGDHYIYGIVSDGDLMEGVSAEAASYAGALGLGRIIYFYDNNKITIEGTTDLTFTEDVEKRFQAYNWHTLSIDGHDHAQIAKAILAAQAVKDKPTLILTRTTIGFGSPHKANTSEVHGSPLGADELAATKKNLGWAYEDAFHVPEEVRSIFSARVKELKPCYQEWQQCFTTWAAAHPELAASYKASIAKTLPESLFTLLHSEDLLKNNATRSHSGTVLQKIAEHVPYVVGGSADLAPSTSTWMKKFPAVEKNSFGGKNFHFGIREHGMGGVLNGMAYYGTTIPFGATFLVFSDYMRGAIRLAALSKLQVIYVFTHDSIFLGEDGPTHQPVEHQSALRVIPNLNVVRPADGLETLAAWTCALKHTTGPTALLLSRQKTGIVKRNVEFTEEAFAKGGYVALKEASGTKPEVVLISNGSELSITIEAALKLEQTHRVRVVSVPSLSVLEKQSAEYITSLIPAQAKVVVVEASLTQGWGDFIRQPLLKLGLDGFGKSAPLEVLAEHYGFTPEKIAARVSAWMTTLS